MVFAFVYSVEGLAPRDAATRMQSSSTQLTRPPTPNQHNQKADPSLARTVVVSTKLDTRIPQFATPSDVDTFLRASGVLDSQMLGGAPFFTSVPSGRVGPAKEAVFRSNDHFRDAVAERERLVREGCVLRELCVCVYGAGCGGGSCAAAALDTQHSSSPSKKTNKPKTKTKKDRAELEAKLQRRLEPGELQRLGVTQLRRFLEQLLQRRYLENVPSIVPLLEREYRTAAARLAATRDELNDLESDKLRVSYLVWFF